MSVWLDPFREALDGLDAPLTLFFRDDDAGWRDDRLLALLDLFARHEVPVDVAAIPAALGPRLARELAARADGPLAVHQHGFAHVDHERDGRRCEFGSSRARARQLADLAAGRDRLQALLGPLVAPLFTPPWNRCTEETASCLAALGFECLSREWRAPALGALPELPVHVDWFGRVEVGAALAARVGAGGPVGVMLHHAPMEPRDFAALGELLALVAEHGAVRCAPMTDLLAAGAPA